MPRLTQRQYEVNYRTLQGFYRSRSQALLGLSATDQFLLTSYYSPSTVDHSSHAIYQHRQRTDKIHPLMAQSAGKIFRELLNHDIRSHRGYVLVKHAS